MKHFSSTFFFGSTQATTIGISGNYNTTSNVGMGKGHELRDWGSGSALISHYFFGASLVSEGGL